MSKMAVAQNNDYNTVTDKDEPNDGVIRKHTRLIGAFFNFGTQSTLAWCIIFSQSLFYLRMRASLPKLML